MSASRRAALLVILAACGGNDGFTPNNVNTFACAETAAACTANDEDPTCSTTEPDYRETACEDGAFVSDLGACDEDDVWLTVEGLERQWTVFDANGVLVAIIGVDRNDAPTCEVGPAELVLPCAPKTIAFMDPCPVP